MEAFLKAFPAALAASARLTAALQAVDLPVDLPVVLMVAIADINIFKAAAVRIAVGSRLHHGRRAAARRCASGCGRCKDGSG